MRRLRGGTALAPSAGRGGHWRLTRRGGAYDRGVWEGHVTNRDRVIDRMSIITNLRRYAFAIDDRDFDTVRSLFTRDAHLDYTSSGGPVGPRDEVVAWIEQGLALVGPTQHLISNEVVALDGAGARSRCYLFNPLLSKDDPPSNVLLLGGEYVDTWQRGPEGWRITERTHRVLWTRNLHDGS